MGQYYMPYVKQGKKEIKFDNRVDGEWEGLKLMEHSYCGNNYVGQVINQIFYKKGKVCWVGDYYNEDDYYQINCDDKEEVKRIGDLVWDDDSPLKETKSTVKNSRRLNGCLLVNHTKKCFIDFDEYYESNKWMEEWKGRQYPCCIHPLPLLTCSASHSGGAYYGINKDLCGSWFNDELEVVYNYEDERLIQKGYTKFEVWFSEQ